jgi:dTDP-4-amino-4,6-dideoxygalactose transaminase
MEIPFVNLTRISEKIRPELDAAYARVLGSSSFILGKEVENFEAEFAKFVGVKRAIGVASGTDALMLMLKALGVGKGDEVIVPSHTFVATAFAVSMVGAKPVFAEVDEYYTLAPDAAEKAVSKKTKAILPVHLYGQCADMTGLSEVAQRHNLLLLEDAAQAHGASLNGKNAGTFGKAAGFSFYPGKNLGALGDAGAVCTDDDALAEKLVAMRNYGSKVKYYHDTMGYNSRLDGLQAAFLSAKLAHLQDWTAQRRAVAAKYVAGLEVLGRLVKLPRERPGAHHVYHLFVVQVHESVRDAIVKQLNDAGVRAQIHYPIPCHQQKAYTEHLPFRKKPLRATEKLTRRILSLPIWPYMQDDEVAFVIEKTAEAVKQHGKKLGR